MIDIKAKGNRIGKCNKPKVNPCNQQTIPAWKPILTAGSVYHIFFIVGVIFIPTGIIILLHVENIKEVSITYTHCKSDGTGTMCSEELKKPEYFGNYLTCNCTENFTISEPMLGQVYVYYGLTNFYQNYRRYLKSRDNKQLNNQYQTKVSDTCSPYMNITDGSVTKYYAPCGSIANSLFNDTFQLFFKGPGGTEYIPVDVTKKGIAWPTDVDLKFKKVTDWSGTLKPPNWKVPAYERDPDAYTGDEELIVWMRNAALPTFRKRHRIVLHKNDPFTAGLPAGDYSLKIQYGYPVTAFDGTKRYILTNQGTFSHKNPTIGIMLILLGGIHLIMAFVCLFIHLYIGKNPETIQFDLCGKYPLNAK